jgi:hypothetical protein
MQDILFQRRHLLKGLAITSQLPVTLQFRIVKVDPFSHQPQGCFRTQITQEKIPAEIDLCLVALILGVDVGRRLVIVMHPNDDSEKAGDFRHGVLLDFGNVSAK